MKNVLVAGEYLPVMEYVTHDDGGMFDATSGVAIKGQSYIAFYMNGWGGGVKRKAKTLEEAKAHRVRLVEECLGRA